MKINKAGETKSIWNNQIKDNIYDQLIVLNKIIGDIFSYLENHKAFSIISLFVVSIVVRFFTVDFKSLIRIVQRAINPKLSV